MFDKMNVSSFLILQLEQPVAAINALLPSILSSPKQLI